MYWHERLIFFVLGAFALGALFWTLDLPTTEPALKQAFEIMLAWKGALALIMAVLPFKKLRERREKYPYTYPKSVFFSWN